MQSNQNHCEVSHHFIFSKILFFFHQSIKITTRCKLSYHTEFILVDKFFHILNDKRMRSLLQYFKFTVISQLVQGAHHFVRDLEDLSCACCFLIFSHYLEHLAVRSLAKFVLVCKLHWVCFLSLSCVVAHLYSFWNVIN